MFGGPAPDALAALIQMLATLRDARGNTTIRGLDNTQRWTGADYAADDFRRDANVLDGVELLGDGSVADMVWARPSVTVLGIDCPRIAGSSAAVQPEARALVSLRVPPGTDASAAHDALVAHLEAVAPWNVQVDCQRGFQGRPFTGAVAGPGFDAMTSALREVYGCDPVLLGSGGSIPLCNVFQETYPDAEIMLLGVEEPLCLIHAPNESVDPREIENMAVVEARFLMEFGQVTSA
jgi:acetylornithine deacetylase/succinyl-diaminopimelate desuccinylase-like protein